MNNENQNFFDSKTIMAVVLVAITFIAWQMYMQKKYPAVYGQKTAKVGQIKTNQTSAKSKLAPSSGDTQTAVAEAGAPEAPAQTQAPIKETLVHYQSPTLSFDISSRGMGLKNVKVLKYKDRKQHVITMGPKSEDALPLATSLLGRSDVLNFKISQVNPNLFVGRASVGNLTVTKTLEVHPADYALNYKVAASGEDSRFVGFTTILSDRIQNLPSGNFLNHSYDEQDFFVQNSDTQDRVIFGTDDKEQTWSKVRIASVGSQYFAQAIVDKSAIMPEAKAKLDHKDGLAEIRLDYPVLNRAQNFELDYTAFLGPKSLSLLSKVDSGLTKIVDFGWFDWIGRPLLKLLKWLYTVVGNWGVAIIVMTCLVRLLVLPFSIYSYKSMRAMQAIQPQIKTLREKYKDDQQKQQQEMMALMREHKVNPVGGCLPMLLQVPIFFALDRVLENSIELYQAPFGPWIHDLSLKDPYFVLPVLMGLAMFIQQKITPSTMDPAQAKMLLMMPIVFTVFMISLPSGLALYMLVSTVFGVGQQAYVMRQKTLSSGTT